MKSTDLSAQTPGTIGAAPGMEIIAAGTDQGLQKTKGARTCEKEAVVKADEEVRGGLLRR